MFCLSLSLSERRIELSSSSEVRLYREACVVSAFLVFVSDRRGGLQAERAILYVGDIDFCFQILISCFNLLYVGLDIHGGLSRGCIYDAVIFSNNR